MYPARPREGKRSPCIPPPEPRRDPRPYKEQRVFALGEGISREFVEEDGGQREPEEEEEEQQQQEQNQDEEEEEDEENHEECRPVEAAGPKSRRREYASEGGRPSVRVSSVKSEKRSVGVHRTAAEPRIAATRRTKKRRRPSSRGSETAA